MHGELDPARPGCTHTVRSELSRSQLKAVLSNGSMLA